jgi:hypothetical protein
MNLESFTVIFFLLTGMRRVTRRWRRTGHNSLATLL